MFKNKPIRTALKKFFADRPLRRLFSKKATLWEHRDLERRHGLLAKRVSELEQKQL